MSFTQPGTFFGLPDLGLSERLGIGSQNPDVLNKGSALYNVKSPVPSSQAGNPNLFVDPTARAGYIQTRAENQYTTTQPQQQQPPSSGQQPGPAPTSELDQLLAMEREGSINPSQRSRLQMLMEERPQQPSIDYDALIAPALAAADESMRAEETSLAANLGSIDASSARQKGGYEASRKEAEGSAQLAKQQNVQGTESAIDEARRQFSQISQGIQAKYGGTTGTGAFAETYLGGETLRGISQKRTALTNALSVIDQSLEKVKLVTDMGIQDVDRQSEADKQQAKAEFERNMVSIRNSRGEILARKAELAAQAMEKYRQDVAAVDQRNAQFKQQLYINQQQAEYALAQKQAGIKEAVQKLTLVNTDNGPVIFNPATGEVQPAQPQAWLSTGGLSEEEKRLRAINGT